MVSCVNEKLIMRHRRFLPAVTIMCPLRGLFMRYTYTSRSGCDTTPAPSFSTTPDPSSKRRGSLYLLFHERHCRMLPKRTLHEELPLLYSPVTHQQAVRGGARGGAEGEARGGVKGGVRVHIQKHNNSRGFATLHPCLQSRPPPRGLC